MQYSMDACGRARALWWRTRYPTDSPICPRGSVALSFQIQRYRICKQTWYEVDHGYTVVQSNNATATFSVRSAATRFATEIAAMRRGWVTMTLTWG